MMRVRWWPSRVCALVLVGALAAAGASALGPHVAAATSPIPQWSQLTTTSPGASGAGSMADDPSLGGLVYFGGTNATGTSYSNQTWEFNGSTWTQVSTPTTPPARFGAMMDYLPSLGDVVLFGGLSATGLLGDTWLFNGTTWTQVVTPGPSARYFASMAYDPGLSDLVLFAGLTSLNAGTVANDTWSFNGATWNHLSTPDSPPARESASMAYDGATSSMVLFGGDNVSNLLDDTWSFTGSTWTQQSPATSPPYIDYASMAYDGAASDLALFGGLSADSPTDGSSPSNALWTYDGTNWTSVSTSPAPGSRFAAPMVYDPTNDSVMLVDGSQSTTTLSDTWGLDVAAPATPVLTSVSPGNLSVSATWTPSAGPLVASYTVTASGAGSSASCTTTSTTCAVVGLTAGVNYSVTVTAANSVGTSEPSSALSAAPGVAPGAPTLTSAAPGAGSITTSWLAPTSPGSSPITGYIATAVNTTTSQSYSCTTATTSCVISSLPTGYSYSVSVLAVNAVGNSLASTAIVVSEATVPGPPTFFSLSSAMGSFDASWYSDTATGGSPLTDYVLSATDGTHTVACTTTATTCTISGLTNGVTYSVSLVAQNAVGSSAPATSSVTPGVNITPDAPDAGSVEDAGDGSVQVTWIAAHDVVTANVTGYTATATPTSEGTSDSCSVSGATVTSCTIGGLSDLDAYTVTVVATNAFGNSVGSTPLSITVGVQPGPPSNLVVTPLNSALAVSWLAPSYAGESPITDYVATAYRSVGATQTCTTSSLSCTFSGLTNGAAVVVNVVAQNAAGSSLIVGTTATPVGPPTPPSIAQVQTGDGVLGVTINPSSNNGGSSLVTYVVSASDGTNTYTCTVTFTACAIFGLTNGVLYTIWATASTTYGTSLASASVTAMPVGAPLAPSLTSVSPGNASLSATWTPPQTDGGQPITGYTLSAQGDATTSTCTTTLLTCTITGLTNAVTYTVWVTATNVDGTSTYSSTQWVIPTGPPSAPTILQVIAGDGDLRVLWSAPSSTGGLAISTYTLSASGGGTSTSCMTSALVCTLTNLTDGVSYSVNVTATNSAGTSPPSPSVTGVPEGVPGAPSLVSVTPSVGQITVAWTAPGSDGGSSVTGYIASAVAGTTTYSCTTTALSCTIASVPSGVSLDVSVVATNANGSSPASSVAAIIIASAPSAPTLSAATPSDTQITVHWIPPTTSGSSSIVSYTASAVGAGTTSSCVTSALSCTITGLTDGVTYSVSVVATNSELTSSASQTLSATPASAPGAPTLVSATAASTQIVVSWNPPTTDGGSSLTSYVASATTGDSSVTCTTTALTCTITGLTNGVTYSVSVVAANAVATSAASSPLDAEPQGPPNAPTIVTASAGDATASVTWTAPAPVAGSAVTGYVLSAVGGATTVTCTTTSLSCTLTGLTDGVTYSVSVVALSASSSSSPSNLATVTPLGLAGAPTLVSLAAGTAQIVVIWSAPSVTGGAPLETYTASATGAGVTRSCTTTSLSCTITGLTNGVVYSVSVVVATSQGNSLASNTLSATPFNPLSAPTITHVTSAPHQLTVFWSAPSSSGAGPIASYSATATNATTTRSCVTTTLSCVITGLSDASSYVVTVTVTNHVAASATSTGVTASLASAPSTPVWTKITPAGSKVSFTWSAPATGGSPITSYSVSLVGTSTTLHCTTSSTSCVITGLANNATYATSLSATNAYGTSAATSVLHVFATAAKAFSVTGQFPVAATGATFLALVSAAPASTLVHVRLGTHGVVACTTNLAGECAVALSSSTAGALSIVATYTSGSTTKTATALARVARVTVSPTSTATGAPIKISITGGVAATTMRVTGTSIASSVVLNASGAGSLTIAGTTAGPLVITVSDDGVTLATVSLTIT